MMPLKSLTLPLRSWTCPQCRAFTSTAAPRQLGPEHPNYIPIPLPPQQTLPHRPFIKGRLPIPRDVFAGAEGRDKSSDAWLDPHTKTRRRAHPAKPGSRDEWQNKISSLRKQNLREGLLSLKARRETESAAATAKSEKNQRARHEALTAPEREDERLTAPSHGLDLEHLYHGYIPNSPGVRPDPTRSERITRMRANVAAQASAAASTRAAHLNTLYMNARHFIVTPAQLDRAVDEAFGSAEAPVRWTDAAGAQPENMASVWAYGKQDRVQDLLNRVNGVGGAKALDGGLRTSGIVGERVGRLAEVFTGGRMAGKEEGS
ncbi:hypothetical protein LTR53_015722 [Teratosphaeriaceae sp. CCFEE 6253]|nr:hypothetical protein LTR53_015722 [Teratosphaeriaceae sp. CCFEE 6253]